MALPERSSSPIDEDCRAGPERRRVTDDGVGPGRLLVETAARPAGAEVDQAVSTGSAGAGVPRRSYLASPYASVQLMLLAGGGLLLAGITMATSTTISASLQNGGGIWTQLSRELTYLGLSVPVFWLAVRMPPAAYRRLAYPVLGLSLMLLIAVLVPGIGATINGAHRWIQLGSLSLQPSEFAKFAVLLWSADLLARKQRLKTLTRIRHVLIPLVPCFVVVIVLVMLEPDLGTTLCFIVILLAVLWTVGLPVRYFVAMVGAVIVAVTLLAFASPYRLQRLTTFLHPSVDQLGSGYQTMQGLQALQSGGLFGVGLGGGASKYGWLPNANTDYVVAVIGQETGLLGCAVVIGLFGLFVYCGLRTAVRSRDRFVQLMATGAALWTGGQAVINIGYVTGLLPVTGIPLPFVSYGGTSLLLTCLVWGMLLSFARHEPAAIAATERARGTGATPRWIRLSGMATARVGHPTQPTSAAVVNASSAPQQRAESGSIARRSSLPERLGPSQIPPAVHEGTSRPSQSTGLDLPATGTDGR